MRHTSSSRVEIDHCGRLYAVCGERQSAESHSPHTHSLGDAARSYMRSSPEPSMAVKSATQGPGSCKKKADIGAQLTSLMEVGSTLYCGAGPSFTSTCSFFFLACRLLRLVGLLPRPTPGILTTYFGSGFDFFSGRTT